MKPGWAADELSIWGHDPVVSGTRLQGNCVPDAQAWHYRIGTKLPEYPRPWHLTKALVREGIQSLSSLDGSKNLAFIEYRPLAP